MAAVLAACGGDTSSPPERGGSSSPVSINGTEQIGWDQAVASGRIDRYEFLLYVDDEPHTLRDATCQSGSTAATFACSSPLPSMTSGAHRLALSTRDVDGSES